MARSKRASKKPVAKKAAKTGKGRAGAGKATAKKATTTRAQRGPGRNAAANRKNVTATKKAAIARRPKAANSAKAAELDSRIAILRNNLRALVEQAASVTGASSEELLAERIAEQEAKLAELTKQRDAL